MEHLPFSFGGKATLFHGWGWGCYSGTDTKIHVKDITWSVPNGAAWTLKFHSVHGNAAACYDPGSEMTHSYNPKNSAYRGDIAKVGQFTVSIGCIGCVLIEYSYPEICANGQYPDFNTTPNTKEQMSNW